MIDKKNMEIKTVNLSDLKKIYLSDIFAKAKDDDVWETNEKKLSLLIFSKISDYRIYHKDLKDIKSLTDPKIDNLISKMNRKYKITKKEFQLATNTNYKNLSREIKKASKELVKRSCNLPHPLDPDNEDSFNIIQLFSSIKYNMKTGIIDVNFNDESLPYILYLNKYTIFILTNFFGLKNKYALHMYMYCKILQNKYTKEGAIKSTIEEFKDDLKIANKYRSFNTFKIYVLDVIKKEINSLTDLCFEYELEKEGKKYTYIILKFSEKRIIEKEVYTTPNQQIQDKDTETKIEDEKVFYSYLKDELIRYGTKASKAENLLNEYGCGTIDTAIEKTRAEIKKGKEIKNLAGYLIKCIENYSPIIDSSEIKAEFKHQEIVAKEVNDENERRWSEVEEFCSINEKKIDILYQVLKNNTTLLHQADIDFLNELKLFVEFYGEFNAHKRVIFDAFVDKGKTAIGFPILEAIVAKTKVAETIERLPYIKKGILEKQAKLDKMEDGVDKDLIKNDIEEMNQLLFSLI